VVEPLLTTGLVAVVRVGLPAGAALPADEVGVAERPLEAAAVAAGLAAAAGDGARLLLVAAGFCLLVQPTD